jgi:hypothetical protein
MLGFVASNFRDGCENMREMSGGTLDAVAMIDLSLSRFLIDGKFIKVVVKISVSSAQIA